MRVAAAAWLVIITSGCGGGSGPATPSGSPSPVAAPPASPLPSPLPSASPSPETPSTPPGPGLALSCQASPRTGPAPLQVAFASFPTGATGSYEFEWAFGDGGTSTNPNPSYTYATAGQFDAVVRVTSGGESTTCARDITVTAPPVTGPTPTPSPGLATVTITSAGVSPSNVQISRGGSVRFVNQSGSPHEMRSNPHPFHTDCPPLNQVPSLNPGQSGQTGAFTTVGTCGYHDHMLPNDGRWQGTIQVNP